MNIDKNMICCIFVIFALSMISFNMLCGCSGIKEGMGAAISWKTGQGLPNNWKQGEAPQNPNVVYPALPLPLDDNHMNIFDKNISGPECKSAYSTGDGMICVTPQQYDYVNRRGGNRAPAFSTYDSEY